MTDAARFHEGRGHHFPGPRLYFRGHLREEDVVAAPWGSRLTPDPEAVVRRVVDHFRKTKRDLPWRRTRDAYAIWVSEIMLQQTRVATVVPFYQRWLERFPTVSALARADLEDVLAAWSGLGYYRRAQNLHRGAREVMARYGGAVPAEVAALRTLPGVGRYTAGAIASLAFGRREALVDGNVARVLARLYLVEEELGSAAATRRLWQLAAALVPGDAPGDFNQGLMELGATLCTPTKPACLACPLRSLCRARAAGRQQELPRTRAPRAAAELPLLGSAAAWIERRRRLLVVRRVPEGLYGGLWELPQAGDESGFSSLFRAPITALTAAPVWVHRQVLSHRRLEIRVWPARIAGPPGRPCDTRYERATWHHLDELDELAVSAATAAIVQTYRERNGWSSTDKHSNVLSRATRRFSKGSRSWAIGPTGTTTLPRPRRGRPGGSRS